MAHHQVASVVLAFAVAAWAQDDAKKSAVTMLKEEAAALVPLAKSDAAREFLEATANLSEISQRTLYRDGQGAWLTEKQFEALNEGDREGFTPFPVSDTFFYYTRYGTPLAYFRALDVAGQNGLDSLRSRKILDFGYGTVGHLRIMASRTAQTVGVDVDPMLTALYSEPGDSGDINTTLHAGGHIKLVSGRFSDDAVKQQLGTGFDLITSKNTLKRGYIHPPEEEQVDKRMLVDLGLSDEAFMRTMHDLLKPGGLFVIYNLSMNLKPDQKYHPASDGRCPFDRELLEKIGFQVLHYDASDNETAHVMAQRLGWDQPPGRGMNIDDLVALYTVLRKPEH
jgi:SAM-dependent methyltransferase